jgi:hypothetical protein
VRRALLLAAACALYAIAAWSVRPGFYDGLPGPQYAYVAPPPVLAAGNVAPTSGSGDLTASGGFVDTHDQPISQAAITVPAGALAGPAHVDIAPSAPPHVAGITLEGNVYCITSSTPLSEGTTAQVSLLVPPTEPFPSAMYFAPDQTGPWRSIGGQVDLNTYLMSASTSSFGCFAVGYVTPKPGQGPTVSGFLLPLVVAVLIAAVVLAGLPLAVRRR